MDYKILSLKYDGDIYDLSPFKYNDGSYKYIKNANPNTFCTLNCLAEFEEVTIHSVARLSDGEIISVGDKTVSGTIAKINIRDNDIWFYHGPLSGPNLHLSDVKPLKESESPITIHDASYNNKLLLLL
jgi:hypothetical protein